MICGIYTMCHLSNVAELHDSVNVTNCGVDKEIHDSFQFLVSYDLGASLL
jgi:hypothetical protein